jgi:hypothetical protein
MALTFEVFYSFKKRLTPVEGNTVTEGDGGTDEKFQESKKVSFIKEIK